MRTLRSRLLLGTGLGIMIVLSVSGMLVYALIETALWNQFDESLAAKARLLAAMAEQEGDRLELEFDEAGLPEYMASPQAELYQVWVHGTEVFARSPSLQGRDLPLSQGTFEKPCIESVVFPDGREGRVFGVSFFPRIDNQEEASDSPLEMTLVVGRETAQIRNTLKQIRTAMSVVGLAAIIVSGSVLTMFVRRGLKPVDQLVTQIEKLGEDELSHRLQVPDLPAELSPVVDRLNALLDRLESAFKRESRFTANVAHELRTPLAGMRSMMEVTLLRPREPDAYHDIMQNCLNINQQIQQIVENLLCLAKADAGQLRTMTEEIDLGELIQECWQPHSADADQKGLHLMWQLAKPCILESDVATLRLILQNILSNAVTHANDGGQISTVLASRDNQVELRITNTGSKISTDDAERVFDRFWRGDRSREATGQHCGLGLSLCKTLVSLLGGSIHATSVMNHTFTIHITLPQTMNQAHLIHG